ncbi:phosphate ABC transporter permease subunit PstC [Planktothrix agardhii 1811]|uniref:phosphate ABC transporter permease subunit PstC n=1 Tax=Planktothrix agardhii TaxID=1160 RepID=UPI001F36EB05|nr:phosphate ABC transporter permease subunit PstC [Planktothrix agardhii]MCF3581125.1 phosphate ABC transporter permease subunit PstC [Planktothrix agardhii 1811]
MSVLMLLAVIAVLATAAFFLARQRALAATKGNPRLLHSLPGYYGWYGAISVLAPALAALVLWLIVQPMVLEARISATLPAELVADPTAAELTMADVRRVASGLDTAIASGAINEADAQALATGSTDIRALLAESGVALAAEVSPEVLIAAQDYRARLHWGAAGRTAIILLVSVLGLFWGVTRARPDFRARNSVERVILALLIAASSIAILTTVGIVWSMVSETFDFFTKYPAKDFFFSLTWSPNFRGGSDLGILPLIWGTLYITVISMLVSVPIGLFAAIYLAEYASRPVRNWVKPLIEIIAGIPTVVFGIFALVTVGPALRDWFAEPLGLGNSGSSVMTAGIVIGILNIPFISSLSDDIINAVPQSLRDGSLGLGATKSETVKQVILPAALPGIVGAILMAASRAIGETMIVVMGAGAAAKLSLNPFEAMTTMTVKIVGQLTGDTDFAAPETLVAFALGMTLFVITLGLNIFALWIVRKYREQYE